RYVKEAGQSCLLLPGDIAAASHCRELVQRTVAAFGRIDVLVNNAAHQASFQSIEEISDAEWQLTLATNISAMFYLTKAAVPHMT
ncbi:SDR family NAD(P)-dependent oxidoreductase, partial [Mycobacterium tuberculosis]|nr:SDR family NAD(P)-dependent oxidoreductase [Mycobacterium tuberculosis]